MQRHKMLALLVLMVLLMVVLGWGLCHVVTGDFIKGMARYLVKLTGGLFPCILLRLDAAPRSKHKTDFGRQVIRVSQQPRELTAVS